MSFQDSLGCGPDRRTLSSEVLEFEATISGGVLAAERAWSLDKASCFWRFILSANDSALYDRAGGGVHREALEPEATVFSISSLNAKDAETAFDKRSPLRRSIRAVNDSLLYDGDGGGLGREV
jgi:hypothetical protein